MKGRLVLCAVVLSFLVFYSVGLALADCPANMTNYWTLDESAPPYADTVGGKSATCTNCPSPVQGIIGGAQSFSLVGGVGKDVTAPGTDLNFTAADSFTIEFWANTTSCTSGVEIMVGRAENNLQLWVGCNEGGYFKFKARDNLGNDPGTIDSLKPFNDGQWHYIVAIRDTVNKELRLYIDKELQGSIADTVTSDFSASSNFSIGYLPFEGNNYYYSGLLDEIAITKRAISDSEIIDHWNSGAGKNYCGGAPANNPPTKPDLISPANGSSQAETSVTFKWKNSTDPDGDVVKHKLFYSTDPAFTGCVPIEVASAGTAYYAGLGSMGAGFLIMGFSFIGMASRRKRIALLLLGLLILSAGFLVSCGGGGGGSSTPPTVSETTYTVTGLTNATTYYWKVSAEDGKGGATESDAWSFNVN